MLKMFSRSALAASALLISNVMCKNKKQEVYIWGNGTYQARPDALMQFKNYSPKKITNLPDNLISLHFGEFFEAGIDKDGNLYLWSKHQMDANVDEQGKDNLR